MLENNIRGGNCTFLGDKYKESSVGTQFLYIDTNILYEWAMSQYLPTGEFEQITVDDIKSVLQTPDKKDYGYFIDCDLEYPAETKQDTEYLPLCPYETQACNDCFSENMNSVATNSKPTTKLTCDLTDKMGHMTHYLILEFYPKQGMKCS